MKEDMKERIRTAVSEVYGKVANQGRDCSGAAAVSCCGGGRRSLAEISGNVGYSKDDLARIPDGANLGLGCGNPLAFAGVKPGQIVLDLGSGSGMDCFIAADKVGPAGRVIGLDMTEEMVVRARALAEQNGYANVEFRFGRIEEMPVEDSSVDWIISNCVVNLSPEKDKVFAEAYRVLKPGGRILISDVVVENMPEVWKGNLESWAACVAGALAEEEYLGIIRKAGFSDVTVVDQTEFFMAREPEPVSISSIRVSGVKRYAAV